MREYRKRRTSSNFERRRRGRKPVDYGLLNCWEFEWVKVFRQLRDGAPLPVDYNLNVLNKRFAEAELQWWKKATVKEILGEMNPGMPPPFDELPEAEREKAKLRWTMSAWRRLRDYAEYKRDGEIITLERWLRPKDTPPRAVRRDIWETLSTRNSPPVAIENACEQWKRLADVRANGLTCFPDHVTANLDGFLRIKRDPRYPGSSSAAADDARLDHLARGMAGIMADYSPITAIQRLRTMDHGPDGPLWKQELRRCGCWRCDLKTWEQYWREMEERTRS